MTRPGIVKTPMGRHADYYPECAFDGDEATYYWSNRCPVTNDTFEIMFESPTIINQATLAVRVVTGKPMAPDQDYLRHGRVEVHDGARWIGIGEISGSDASCRSSAVSGAIHGVRVVVVRSQDQWLIIRSITSKIE
jgi:hypothetical protein